MLGLFSIIVMAVIFCSFRSLSGPARAWAKSADGVCLPVRHRAFGAGGLCGHLHRHHRQPEGGHGRAGIHPEIFMAGFRGGAVMGMAVIGTSPGGRGAHLYHLP